MKVDSDHRKLEVLTRVRETRKQGNMIHGNTETQKHRSTETATQKHRNTGTQETQKHRSTDNKTQKHRNTETQKPGDT